MQLFKAMKASDLRGTRLLMRLLTGDPVEAMEAAKKIIGGKDGLAPILLSEVAENRKYKPWSRIGAVYALGFLEFKPGTPGLIRILHESKESLALRCHAAEALGNAQAVGAVAAIELVLMRDEPPSLKKWCIYALSQIGTSQAKTVLTRLKEGKPSGIVAKEISLAFEHLG